MSQFLKNALVTYLGALRAPATINSQKGPHYRSSRNMTCYIQIIYQSAGDLKESKVNKINEIKIWLILLYLVHILSLSTLYAS